MCIRMRNEARLWAYAHNDALTRKDAYIAEHVNEHASKYAKSTRTEAYAGSTTSRYINTAIFTPCRYHELHFWGHMCDKSFVP